MGRLARCELLWLTFCLDVQGRPEYEKDGQVVPWFTSWRERKCFCKHDVHRIEIPRSKHVLMSLES